MLYTIRNRKISVFKIINSIILFPKETLIFINLKMTFGKYEISGIVFLSYFHLKKRSESDLINFLRLQGECS